MRSQKTLPLILLISVALAPIAAVAQPLADRVPDDALLYFGWRGADDPGAAYAQSRLKAMLDASAIPQVVSDVLPKVLDKMAEKDRGAAIFREVVEKLGPTFWRSPTALYVGPVDGLATGQPVPRIALLCQAGAGASQLRKDINSYLDQILAGTMFPVIATEENGIVAVTVGNVTLDLSGKSNTALAGRKEFTEVMAQVGGGKEALAAVYIDVESISLVVERALGLAPPQASQKWFMVRDALGLRGLKRIAWTAGFDGRDFSTQALVLAPAPRTGLMQLLDAGALSDDVLRAVPQSATMMLAGKLDLAKLLAMIRETAGQIEPRAPDGINSGLAIANVAVGINIEEDLIRPLGDEWAVYSSPTVGGVGPLGLVLVNRARDAAKLERSLAILEHALNRELNRGIPHGQARGEFVEATVRGVDVHYLDTPFASPAWAIKDGNLYVALYPQIVATAAASGGSGKSILDNEDFRAMRKRLGGERASSLTFFDLPKTAPIGYPYVLLATRMLGFADMFGIRTPAAVLPPIDQLLPLMAPAGSVSWTDEMGGHSRSVTPFPGATLLGGPEMLLIQGSGTIVPIMMGSYRARSERSAQVERSAPQTQPQPK